MREKEEENHLIQKEEVVVDTQDLIIVVAEEEEEVVLVGTEEVKKGEIEEMRVLAIKKVTEEIVVVKNLLEADLKIINQDPVKEGETNFSSFLQQNLLNKRAQNKLHLQNNYS